VTLFWRFFRDKRRWILWWSVGAGAFVLLSIAFYPAFKELSQFDEQLKDAPEGIRAIMGGQGGISLITPEGFLHSQVFAQALPILLIIFAVGLGSRAIAGSEGDGILELMLANPVTRRRVALERYLTIVAQMIVLGAVATIVVVAFAPIVQLEGLSIPNVLGACLAAICFGIVHASIAFASGAATGKRGMAIATSASIAVGGFVVFGLVSGGILEPLRFLSPWWWYVSRNTVALGLAPEAIWAPLAVSALLVAGSVALFERRDLQAPD
jgi:ABC-2 type transport system permease protein